MDKSDVAPEMPPSRRKKTRQVQPSKKLLKEVTADPTLYRWYSNHSPFHPAFSPVAKATHPPARVDHVEEFSFSDGFSIGGGIFWLQLLTTAGLGLLLNFALLPLLITATDLPELVSATVFCYPLGALLIAYGIPHWKLAYNGVDNPFWLTIFGVVIESMVVGVVGVGFILLVLMVVTPAQLAQALPIGLAQIGTSGLITQILVAGIAFVLMVYFFAKLAWGVAFVLYGRINKLTIKLIDLAIIALGIGGVLYGFLSQR